MIGSHRVGLAAAVVAFVAGVTLAHTTGAQPVPDFDVAKGVGGYLGQVRDIARPVLLRYQSTPHFQFKLQAQGRFDGGARAALQPFALTTEGTGSLLKRGSVVDWAVDVAAMSVEGKLIRSSSPLVRIKVRTDLLGDEIEDPEIDTPGLRELRIDTDRSDLSGPVDAWTTYPEESVRGGDRVTTVRAERLLPLPDDSAVRNTIATVARGLTTIGGREYLVAEVTGGIEATHPEGLVLAEAGGYWLIDLATGLHSGKMKLTVTLNGRTVRQRGTVLAVFNYDAKDSVPR